MRNTSPVWACVLWAALAVALPSARTSDLVELPPSAAAPVGAVSGVIRVRGEPPALPPVALAGGVIAEDVPDESLVIHRTGGLANVFVWLPQPPRPAPPVETAEPVRLMQLSYRFVPRTVILPVGRGMHVINGDALPLNLHITGVRNSAVNVGIPPMNIDGCRLDGREMFHHAERFPIPIRSDFHPFMRAYLLVVDHPFAAVTDEYGRFQIANLPPGEYDLAVWHERTGFLEQRLHVRTTADRPAQVQLEYPVERLLAAPLATR
jgi:hypothetical protein